MNNKKLCELITAWLSAQHYTPTKLEITVDKYILTQKTDTHTHVYELTHSEMFTLQRNIPQGSLEIKILTICNTIIEMQKKGKL